MKKVFNTIVTAITAIISSITNSNPVMTIETAKRTATELTQFKLDVISFIDSMIERCDGIVDEATSLIEEAEQKKKMAKRILEGCSFCRTKVLDHYRHIKSIYDIAREKFDSEPTNSELLEAFLVATKKFSEEQNKTNILLEKIENCENKWKKILAELSGTEDKPSIPANTEATTNKSVCLIDTNGNGTVPLRTNRQGKTVSSQFPFAKFEGNNVFLQTSNEKAEGIDKAFCVAVAEGRILPDKEYLCTVHQSAKGNLFVQSVADKNGNIIVAERSNLDVATVPPAKENRGVYNTMAEAFKKANMKVANQ